MFHVRLLIKKIDVKHAIKILFHYVFRIHEFSFFIISNRNFQFVIIV